MIMEDWTEIRRLVRSDDLSQAEIARRSGTRRNSVARTLRSQEPPKDAHAAKGFAFEPAIRSLLAELPRPLATVIAEQIGWTQSLTGLRVRVRELHLLLVPEDPADGSSTSPARKALCDLCSPRSWSRSRPRSRASGSVGNAQQILAGRAPSRRCWRSHSCNAGASAVAVLAVLAAVQVMLPRKLPMLVLTPTFERSLGEAEAAQRVPLMLARGVHVGLAWLALLLLGAVAVLTDGLDGLVDVEGKCIGLLGHGLAMARAPRARAIPVWLVPLVLCGVMYFAGTPAATGEARA